MKYQRKRTVRYRNLIAPLQQWRLNLTPVHLVVERAAESAILRINWEGNASDLESANLLLKWPLCWTLPKLVWQEITALQGSFRWSQWNTHNLFQEQYYHMVYWSCKYRRRNCNRHIWTENQIVRTDGKLPQYFSGGSICNSKMKSTDCNPSRQQFYLSSSYTTNCKIVWNSLKNWIT